MTPSAKRIIKRFNSLKTLPHVSIKLTQLMADEQTSVRDLEGIIRYDPTLVVRLLKLVNSPYYGLRQKVGSIAEAVTFLGIENLRNIVVVAALKDIFRKCPASNVFLPEKLWLHSAVVAICCQMIAERIFQQKGEDAFLCGILHDIGLIAIAQAEPENFIKIWEQQQGNARDVVLSEKEIVGTDHGALGYYLCNEWKISHNIREGIRRHHQYDGRFSPSDISGILQISEYLTARLDHGMAPGIQVELAPCLREHVRDMIMEYRVVSRDLPEEIAKAAAIYATSEEA